MFWTIGHDGKHHRQFARAVIASIATKNGKSWPTTGKNHQEWFRSTNDVMLGG